MTSITESAGKQMGIDEEKNIAIDGEDDVEQTGIDEDIEEIGIDEEEDIEETHVEKDEEENFEEPSSAGEGVCAIWSMSLIGQVIKMMSYAWFVEWENLMIPQLKHGYSMNYVIFGCMRNAFLAIILIVLMIKSLYATYAKN